MSTAATSEGASGAGVNLYETSRAVDEYLQFHFPDNDLLPYEEGPKTALQFPTRCAQACIEAVGKGRALDVGCAVGGATFALAASFDQVVGLDYSHAFVAAAKDMQEKGTRAYTSRLESDIEEERVANVPENIDRSRVSFEQGDACNLSEELGQFDSVLASNLLCRLPNPMAFLNRLESLVKPGGVVVLVSPYSWLEQWTPKEKWLGGFYKEGKPVRSFDTVKEVLSPHFELEKEGQLPFLIREHARKYQWGCSHLTVWRRKNE